MVCCSCSAVTLTVTTSVLTLAKHVVACLLGLVDGSLSIGGRRQDREDQPFPRAAQGRFGIQTCGPASPPPLVRALASAMKDLLAYLILLAAAILIIAMIAFAGS